MTSTRKLLMSTQKLSRREFLSEVLEALDGMEKKELVTGQLFLEDGGCCAFGAWILHRLGGKDAYASFVTDYGDRYETLAESFGVHLRFVSELYGTNDQLGSPSTGAGEIPAERWARMRKWVERELKWMKTQ